jgi:transposase InsO family protein
LVGISRSTTRYNKRAGPDETDLRDKIEKLSQEHDAYGYRMVTAVLRRSGWRVNHKRVHRIWKEEKLQQPRKTKKKRAVGPKGEVPNKATHPNHVWSYDFVEDRTEFGVKIRVLNIEDEYTRESLFQRAERSIPSTKVLDTLEWLFLIHGAPEHIRSDNGPEFIARKVQAWLEKQGCQTLYINPGSPWENGYIESLNATFRRECLDRHLFRNLKEAQDIIEKWRVEYNEKRPHSSLGYMTPKEFAEKCSRSLRPTACVPLNIKEKEQTLT